MDIIISTTVIVQILSTVNDEHANDTNHDNDDTCTHNQYMYVCVCIYIYIYV